MSHNIELEGGKAKRLLTKGKYCDRDIIVSPENLDERLAQQDVLIEEIKTALQGKSVGGGGGGTVEVKLQEKSVTPTKSAQSVVPDSGYDGLSKVSVGAIPDAYVIPSGSTSITTNGTHLVSGYAIAEVNVPIPDGYIKPSGTKNITENGTHDVKAYESVVVEVPTSGGGDDTEAQDLADVLMNNIEDFENSRITKLGKYAFAYKTNLKTASLPNLATSAERAFSNCDSMTTLSVPNMRGATQTYMCAYCSALTSADVKNASSISTYSFYGCSNLAKVEFNRISSISSNSFNGCTKLATLIIRNLTMATLGATSAFTGTKIAGSGGYIYVPSALIEDYKAATNWSTYASKFRAIEDYPSIAGE